MITAKCVKNVNPTGTGTYDLAVGESYEVEEISMGSSFTFITLKGKSDAYNSICFSFYENGKPLDIYNDARFNPYLK